MDADPTILIVEDNYEHLRLAMYILKKQGTPGDVYVARDGQEALDYLLRRDQFADAARAPRPNVVLLDLNIPRVDGKELLKFIKDDVSLRDIPVVVMSSSDREEDVSYAHAMGVAAYISKSEGFEQLSEALACIRQFLPKKSP